MNHPSKEDWMSYLYAELPSEQQEACAAHLRQCPGCRRTVESWQAALSDLDGYELAPFPKRRAAPMPNFKWAMAALFVFGFGLLLGRLTTPRTPDPKEILAAVAPHLRSQLQQELRADLLAAVESDSRGLTNEFRRELHRGLAQWNVAIYQAARDESEEAAARVAQSLDEVHRRGQQQLFDVVTKLDGQQRGELARLRHDLETVAVVAENRLDLTQTQLGDLASVSLAGVPAPRQ